jgi:hypothetical protein
MKINSRKMIFPAVVLAILFASTVSVGATENANVKSFNGLAIGAQSGQIIMSIANGRNVSVNYTFSVEYGYMRILLRGKSSKTVLLENGTVSANSTLEKTYRVRFSFSPIVATLQVENRTLICVGFVFGIRVIFKATSVVDVI